MAKNGRKRKMGKRTASGQISRAGVDPRDHGTPEIQRRVRAMGGKGTSALMSDQLCAAGIITDEMNEAASVFRWLRERAYGRTGAKIGAYSEMISEGTLRPIMDVNAADDPQARAQARYNEARALLHERGAPGAAVEVTRIVIDDTAPLIRSARDMESLHFALALLASHFIGGDLKIILDRAQRSCEVAQEKHSRKCA